MRGENTGLLPTRWTVRWGGRGREELARAERQVRGEDSREERVRPWGEVRQVEGDTWSTASSIVAGSLVVQRIIN